jgi:SOS-response transcriptional repressor LexA
MTPRQRALMAWLHTRRASGQTPPSFREVAKALGSRQSSLAFGLLHRLARQGMISLDEKRPHLMPRGTLVPAGWLLVTAEDSPRLVPMTDTEANEMLARLLPAPPQGG